MRLNAVTTWFKSSLILVDWEIPLIFNVIQTTSWKLFYSEIEVIKVNHGVIGLAAFGRKLRMMGSGFYLCKTVSQEVIWK